MKARDLTCPVALSGGVKEVREIGRSGPNLSQVISTLQILDKDATFHPFFICRIPVDNHDTRVDNWDKMLAIGM